ncbi:MAG: hypothetical protein Q8P81_02415 [Nanoarchaeota archaeon]|nr:hypothetical protein [Nanoarchaeota archaeon]
MKGTLILGIATLLVLAGFLTYLSTSKIAPDESVNLFGYTYSRTKAVCNGDNYCGDYEIFCDKNKFVNMRFTGAAVQFPPEWKDSRSDEIRNKIC